MESMTKFGAIESSFGFARGGPSYRLLGRLGVIQGDGPSVARRIVFLIAVTWVPLLAFAFFEGRALGATPQESMLLDFATYARFWLALPLLMIADVVVGPRLMHAGASFLSGGFVDGAAVEPFKAAAGRVRKRCEAIAPEIIIVVIALVSAWYLSVERWYGTAAVSWKALALPSGAVSWAGVWNQFVAIPLFQFFFLRWLWRLIIWSCFLHEVSRLDLKLVPTHADQAGGLGFLGTAHTFLGIFSFAMGSVVSADAAFRIYFEGATLESFQLIFAVFISMNELLFIVPLLVFTGPLLRARLEGLRHYSNLTNQYNRAFHARWISGQPSVDEPLLGTADIQSLADLGNSFDRVRAMGDFPFNKQLIIQIAVMSALPGLPLFLLAVPVSQILKLLGAAIL